MENNEKKLIVKNLCETINGEHQKNQQEISHSHQHEEHKLITKLPNSMIPVLEQTVDLSDLSDEKLVIIESDPFLEVTLREKHRNDLTGNFNRLANDSLLSLENFKINTTDKKINSRKINETIDDKVKLLNDEGIIYQEDETFMIQNFGEFSLNDDDDYDDNYLINFSDDHELIRSSIISIDSIKSTNICNVENIIKELLISEKNYIQLLKNGMDNYFPIMELNDLPITLKGHKYTIFSTIEKIYDFHKQTFLPSLMKCNENLEEICHLIRNFIQTGFFYPYVQYGINKIRSYKIARLNEHYIKDRQKNVKLNINKYLLEPFKRIFLYELYFRKIIKEIELHDNCEYKNLLELCRNTEKDLRKLYDLLNEAISINSIQYDEESCKFNLRYLGKFLKASDLDIADQNYIRTKKMKGRLFIFENILIYTEYKINKCHKLYVRGHFKYDTMRIHFDGLEHFHLINSNDNKKKVEFFGIYPIAKDVTDIIEKILSNILENQSKINNEKYLEKKLRKEILIKKIRNDDDITIPWSERKNFDQLRNSEKYYIYMISTNRKLYLSKLPINVKRKYEEFFKTIELIYEFHNTEFYPELIKSGNDFKSVINLFQMTLRNNSFDIYMKYSEIATKIENELKKYHEIPPLNPMLNFHEFIYLPVKRIFDYMTIIDVFVHEFQMKNHQHDIVRNLDFIEAATVQAIFRKFNRKFDENYKLHSIEQTKIDLTKYGKIVYSDLVSLDFFSIINHRIFIMEYGILCVKFRENSKTKREKFIEIVSNGLYTMKMSIRGNKKNLKRIDIDIETNKSVIRITFSTLEKRQMFCDRLSNFII